MSSNELLSHHSTKDLSGQWFGRLFAMRPVGRTKLKGLVWYCLCECGERKCVPSVHLLNGRTKSCGCLRRDVAAEMGRAHGKYNWESNKFAGVFVTGREEKSLEVEAYDISDSVDVANEAERQAAVQTSFKPDIGY